MRTTILGMAVCCVALTMQVTAQLQLPVQWSTYLGGSGDDQIRALCVDRDDNVYVCGVFTSADFPQARGVPSSFDTSRANGGGYLASFSPTGELRWLQYFGCVRPQEVAVSDEGVLVMVGATAVECGRVDATISAFTTAGERYAQAYVLGGPSEIDIATSVDIVGSTIYVGGITQSPDLQTTANAFQAGPQGGVDGFVAKLKLATSPSGVLIVPDVVSYFGGRYLDEVLVVRARNTLGHVYVGGRTLSDKLPGNGVLQPTRIGNPLVDDDGFVARLDSSSLACQWYTYCGGTGNDVVYGLQPYRSNQPGAGGEPFTLRVCGVYSGSSFPHLGNPTWSVPFDGGTRRGGDGFLLQIRDGAEIQAVTWTVNTTGDDILCSFTRGNTNTGPLMFSNGFFTCQNSTYNAYRLNPYPGSNPTGLSAFCGNNDEVTLDVEQYRFGFGGIDEGPNSTYICGSTTSTVINGTDAPGPILQRTLGGGRDGFLVKVGCGARTTRIQASDSLLCTTGDSATLTVQPNPQSVQWEDGSTSATRVVREPGTYKIAFIEPNGCQFIDSITIRSGSQPVGTLSPSDTITICDTSTTLIRLRGSNIATVQWSGGEVIDDTTIRVRQPGRYAARLVSADGCVVITDSVTVVATSLPPGAGVALAPLASSSVGAGDTLGLLLRIVPPPGSALAQLPTEWSGRLRVDRSVLLPLPPLELGVRDDSIRTIRLQGSRTPGSDTLAVLFLRAALGVVDSVSIEVDSLTLQPCGDQLPAESIVIRLSDICREGGTRLVSTSSVRLRASITSNPIGSAGGTATAVGIDAADATASIVSVLGTELPMTELQRTAESVQWHVPAWLPVGRYVLVVRSASARTAVPFEVIR